MYKIYLDDVRTPIDSNWVVVRDYDEFINKVDELGLENIELISLDHDLGDTAMREYYTNVTDNFYIDYGNIEEKTGLDAAKFLVTKFYLKYPQRLSMGGLQKRNEKFIFPKIVVHSANPIGAHNIMGYINNFYKNERQPQNCVRVQISHNTIDDYE